MQHLKTRNNRIALALTIGLGIAIIFGTLMPSSAQPSLSSNDKITHFVAFAALVFPLALARSYPALVILVVAVVFGGLVEIMQPYFGRSQEGLDLLADTFGAIFGIVTARAITFFGSRVTP